MYKDMIIGVIFKLKWRIIPVAVWNCCLFELLFHVFLHALLPLCFKTLSSISNPMTSCYISFLKRGVFQQGEGCCRVRIILRTYFSLPLKFNARQILRQRFVSVQKSTESQLSRHIIYLLLCSHLFPLKPETQLHLNVVPLLLHLPSFKHGNESHGKSIVQNNGMVIIN